MAEPVCTGFRHCPRCLGLAGNGADRSSKCLGIFVQAPAVPADSDRRTSQQIKSRGQPNPLQVSAWGLTQFPVRPKPVALLKKLNLKNLKTAELPSFNEVMRQEEV
mmetsp:Transcript_36700/g.81934  ORF Transcript_36700/g.81934 Transcript_36700/m.81934 type:complete len:106 (-) Transcript_36700:1179-1496(-)